MALKEEIHNIKVEYLLLYCITTLINYDDITCDTGNIKSPPE